MLLYLYSVLVAAPYPQRFGKKGLQSVLSKWQHKPCLVQRGLFDQLSNYGRKNDENVCTKRAFISVSHSEYSESLT